MRRSGIASGRFPAGLRRAPAARPRGGHGRALLLAGLAALAGCSSQAWYEGVQAGARQRCLEGPPAARDECMARQNHKGYEEYRREREDATTSP